jgi:hypothetical protein
MKGEKPPAAVGGRYNCLTMARSFRARDERGSEEKNTGLKTCLRRAGRVMWNSCVRRYNQLVEVY